MRIIAGEWRGRQIRAPKGKGTRPTADRVREAWMSAMGPSIPGARVLDLFAGSGALGLECLSRGAEEVVFVERARSALRVLRANIEELGAQGRCRVVVGDALTLAGSLEPGMFALALADPPYDSGDAGRLVELFRRRPFAGQLWLEHRNRDPIAEGGGGRTRSYGDTALTTVDAPDWEGPTLVAKELEVPPPDPAEPGNDLAIPDRDLPSPDPDLRDDRSP